MLKIEVIKFEAQDVITTSVAAPTEAPTATPVAPAAPAAPVKEEKPAEASCICSAEVPYSRCYYNGTHAECEAQPYDGLHNCIDYGPVN